MTTIYFLLYLLFNPRLAVGLLYVFNMDDRGQVIADVKTKRIIYANQSFLRHIGRSLEELRNKPFTDFINDAEDTDAAVEVLKDGQSLFSYENDYIRPDGSLAHCEWRAIIYDGNYVCTTKLK